LREDILHHLPGKTVDHIQPTFRIILTAVIAACVFAGGCSTASKPLAEAPLPTPSVQADQPHELAKLPPAAPNEVQEAVKRVFKESALVDTSRNPAFVTGDFNGDQSQDLAVVLKPDAARLADLNEEFPNWILRDLDGTGESRSPRLLVGADEVLLAIIHGFGPNGWRDQQAMQTFLLKHAAGSRMEAQSTKDFMAANHGRKVPSLRGDVVAEVLGAKTGYLYYGNATYSWYDPRTFAGEPEAQPGHGGPKMKQ
jgi:hypothetical protein